MTVDSNAAETLSLNRLFELVSREPRRRVLDAMRTRSPRTVEELARPGWFGDLERGTIEISLCHNHLPRLDAAGVVRWKRDLGVVYRGPRFGEVRPFLDLMADNGDGLPTGWP